MLLQVVVEDGGEGHHGPLTVHTIVHTHTHTHTHKYSHTYTHNNNNNNNNNNNTLSQKQRKSWTDIILDNEQTHAFYHLKVAASSPCSTPTTPPTNPISFVGAITISSSPVAACTGIKDWE